MLNVTGFEIPDGDAEKLVKPGDIVRYVADREDIYEWKLKTLFVLF